MRFFLGLAMRLTSLIARQLYRKVKNPMGVEDSIYLLPPLLMIVI
jgi:hypothetical protein